MSIIPNEGAPEETKAPELTEIEFFLEKNEEYVRTVALANARPDEEWIRIVHLYRQLASTSTENFRAESFFRESGDDMWVQAAVGAVMNATESLWRTASVINPESPTAISFNDDFREQILDPLLLQPDEDEEKIQKAARAVDFLCRTHIDAVENLFAKFMTTNQVVDYTVNGKIREQLGNRLANFGLVSAAAFVGTALAYALANKKPKTF